MGAIWRKRQGLQSLQEGEAVAEAFKIAQELSVPQKLIEVLLNRGIREPEHIQDYFSPKLKSLRDPLSIRDMAKAVDRLETAFDKGEKICVYADYDLDGSSGLALLYKGLKKCGFENLSYYQPKRLTEGYGVHVSAIEQLHKEGVQVVITVDVGITAFEALKRARELGMDVILTDHHLPAEKLPEAYAIVNPNCGDCTSKLGHLSGAGVAFYFLLAVKRRLTENKKLKREFDPKTLLDFFAIGTLTDMVPLVGENRSLVRHGLKQLSKTPRPGLRRLLQELNLTGRDLTSQDVAIQFAPKLNALSRMEIGLLPVDLFFVESDEAAEEMVSTVSTNNKKRKDLQAFAEAWAAEHALPTVAKGFALVSSSKFHKGVIGLVATRLTQKFGVAAFVGAESEKEIVGSARAPDRSGIHLIEVFEHCRASLTRFGGHAQAAGFALSPDKLPEFEAALTDYFKNFQVPEIVLEYDTEITLPEIDDRLVRSQSLLEPFGQGFQQPRYRLKSEMVKESIMSGGHKKITVADGSKSLDMVYFSPPENLSLSPGPIEALVRLQKNYFRGRESLQILVDDLRSF